MVFIEWKTEYSVGHTTMDHDHRHLAEIINRLYQALDANEATPQIGATLSALRHYVETHFDREERLLKACDFPDLVNHVRSHRQIEQTLEDFENLYASSPDNLDTDALLAFLRRWLITHILHDDRDYKGFLTDETTFKTSHQVAHKVEASDP